MLQRRLTRVMRDCVAVSAETARAGRDGVTAQARRMLFVLVAMLAVMAPAIAMAASPGCIAVNAGAFNQSTTYNAGAVQTTNARETIGSTTYNGIITNNWTGATTAARWYNGGQQLSFTLGEVITINGTVNSTNGTLRAALYRGGTSTTVGVLINSVTATGSFSYTVVSPEYAFDARLLQSTSGTGTVSLTAACLQAPPSISAVSPTQGPLTAGAAVTITGSNLENASSVTFGGVAATINSSATGSISVTAPSGSAGPATVSVTTPGGTATSSYTYVAAPTVSSISPTAGPTSGGATVVITGTNFNAAPTTGAVLFGSASATYTIDSSTQITATAPANAAGPYDVTVTTPGGVSATGAGSAFTYVAAPTVTSISPTAGPTSGGTSVVITGTNLSGATAVTFGATAATGFTVDSSTQITATSPGGAAGIVDVRVTTVGGTSTISTSDRFTYVNAPTVTSISPTAGSTAGGASVVITGTNLSNATAVTFGGTAATGYIVDGATQITATSPAGAASTVDVRVTTAGGTSATSSGDQFTYVAAPTGNSFTYGSIVAYNDGANLTTNIDVATGGNVQNNPTSYAVGSATTSAGGSVTIDSSGMATYTPPVGYRNANDSFTYTATNVGGTSAPAIVTVTLDNPTFSVSLPSATATVERAYNAAATPVSVSGGQAAYTINSISGLPSGLTDAGGGVISGTPTANGVYTVTVSITDSSTGAGPYTANATATLTVSLPPAPVASPFTASAVAYNTGSASATTFSAAANATNSPTSYAVGSAATANGGSVSINSAGLVSFTPAVGFRGNDSFTFTATNAGGTSSLATVTVPVNNPVFSVTLPASTGTVGVAYNSGASVVTVSGGQGPYSGFSATGLPAGLTMSSSGVISGTPTTATNATVVVTLTDSSTGTGAYTSTASASLNISAPTITLSPAAGALPGAQAGVSYSQSVTSTGGYAPIVYSVSSGATPSGVVVAANGTISGAPTATGTFNFTVTAQDSSGNAYTGSSSYSITVAAPTITLGSTLAGGTIGASYSQTLLASGGNAPYSFALTSGSLPAGLTLATGGLLSGTPTEGGSFPITITATDSTSGGTYTGSQAYTLVIGSPTITLSPGSLPNGAIAASYSQSLTASGGTSGYSYAVTAGSLPPGLNLSTGGALTGTPTGAGTYNFTITATDSSTGAGPYTGAAAYALTVDAPTLALAPTSLSNAAVASAYNATLTASGGTGPYSYAVTSGALPPGVTLSTSGALSGTPTAGGVFTFDVTATDSSTGTGAPFSTTRGYTLTVSAPTITVAPASLTATTVAAAVNETITASGGTSTYSYAVTAGALPAGVTLSSGGALTGAPTSAGLFTFTVTATDSSTGAGPYTGSATYNWTVGAPTVSVDPPTLSNGQVGQPYSQTATASGGVSPYVFSVTGALPAGVTLSTGGALTGTPTAAGSFTFTITATDSATGVGAPFTGSRAYTVNIGNPTLSLAPSNLAAMTVAAPFNATITAGGGTAPYAYALSGGAMPTGLTLSSTGEITGTPTASGPFSFTIAATDSSTGTGAPFAVTRTYNVTVGSPTLTMAPSTLQAAVQHTAYSETLAASGGTSPYSYTVASGSLPAGLTLATGGVLSGVPTDTGTFNVTIRATDSTTGGGPFIVETLYSLVVNVPAPPTTNAVSATVAANSSANAIAPSLTGVPATSIAIATAPAHGTATIVGAGAGATFDYTPTPGYSGADTFTYTASNAGGTSAPATVTITVAAPTLAIAGTPPGGVVAVAYVDAAFTATTGTAPYSFTGASLPGGLSLSTAGVLSGTPTAAGTFNAVITATDAYGAIGSATFPITIAAPTVTITSPTAGALPTATAFVAYSQTFAASGGATPRTFAVTAGALPSGLTLSSAGVLSGSPTSVGTFNFTVTPSDGSGSPGPYVGASSAYSLVVSAPTMTLAPSSVPGGTVTAPYTPTTFTAAGGAAPYSYAVTAGALPSGLTLSSGGVLSGAAAQAAAGTFNFTITATDANGFTVSGLYSLTMAPVTLTTGAPASGVAGTVYNQALSTTGGAAPYSYAVTAGALPAGLTLSSAGQLTGTPTVAGTFNFTATATDANGAVGASALTLEILAPTLSMTPASLPDGTVTIAYPSTTFAVAGGTAPYSYAVTAGALPSGLTLSSGGVLSGAAAQAAAGTFNFTVTATDAYGFTVSGPYSLTMAPVTLTTGAPASGVAGTPYNQALSTTGGAAPYSYAVTAGALPAGLTLSSAGQLTGTPTAAGTFNFTATATDANGAVGASALTLEILAPTLSMTPASLPDGTVTIAYPSTTFSVAGGTAPYSYAVTVGALPTGLALTSAGVLSGTAAQTASGTASFTVTATDAYGFATARAYTLTLAPVTLTVAQPPAGTAGVAYNFALQAAGGTAPYSYAVTAGTLPTGITLSAAGQLAGTPTVAGTFAFTVTATDANGAVGDTALSLVLAAPTISLDATVVDGTATVPFSQTLGATGGTAPYTYAVTAGTLPTGLTLSSAGVLSGVVPQSAVGTYNFTVTATDANGFTGVRAFTSTIAQVTLSVALADDSVQAGQAYNAPVATVGGAGPYSYSIASGSLPPGVSFSSAGVFSGVPTAVGGYALSVTATDSYGAVGSSGVTIQVLEPTLNVTPAALSPAAYGTPFSQTFQTSGGVAPYSYTVTGALPAGVTFTADGVLSGSPMEAGSFPLSIRVTDSTGGQGPYSQRHDVTLVVDEAPPPVVEPVSTDTEAGEPTTIDVSSMIDGFYDTVIITKAPDHGTAVVNNGASRMRSQSGGSVTITYTPNPGYYGPDSFMYAATGPGGTSTPAAISVAVAAPAPVVVNDAASVAANATVAIPVTANDTGPIDTIAIATAPANGTATVSGLTVNYAPAENFFGTDTFTYTATGEGGTGGPATVTVTVSPLAVPSQTAQVITVLAGQSTTLAATQGATGSPFTSVTIATAPTKGAATVTGLTIAYTPAVGFSGADTFTYRIANPFGSSDPIPVTVTVNPAPLTAPPITVEILAGQKAVVDLVAGASGGPFTGAAAATITPSNSGVAAVTSPAAGAYTLTFTPDNAFSGTAVVTYTLSNAFATSAPGRVTVIVKARPDPSQDPEVKGLVAAQDATAIRFADAQISNFSRRLEQLHNGGGAGRGFGVSVRGGDTERDDGLEARERFRKYASLGMNDAADPSSPLLPAASASDAAAANGDDENGQAGPQRWGVWAAGSADFGMRDTVGSQSGFRFTTDGVTAGVDYRVNPRFAFGVGLGYGRDSSRIGKSGTKSRAESYSAGLYASLQPGEKTFIDGVIGYGTLDFDTRRYVTTTGELVTGERDGDQVFAALTFGMEHRTQTSLISPYGRFALSRSQLDAFSEVGGGPYGLTYHARTVRSLTGTLGLRGEFNRKISAGLLSPRFRVEYSHDFEDADDALLSYTDWVGGPTYRLTVDPIDRDQLRLELGADLTVNNGWKIGLDFDNMVSKDSDSQGVRISVQSPF